MFHVAGSLGIFGPWAGGGTAVMMPAFEPGAVMDAIEEHDITDCGFVPTMMAMILQHPEFRPERLGSLRNAGYGAAPMPQGLLTQLLTMYPEMGTYQGYGMTEATGVITYLSPDAHRLGGERLRSVGQPMHGVRFSIRGPDDEELQVREIGEVYVRSGTIMREYWHQPEATAAALRHGWYHTGDMGFLDEDGYLFLVDRVKDMIVWGGENVYSTEVENALSTHPAVAAWPSSASPTSCGARPSTPSSCAARCLRHRGRTQGARPPDAGRYKVPKTIELRAEPFPLSAAGKVLKRELRRPYWERPAEGGS